MLRQLIIFGGLLLNAAGGMAQDPLELLVSVSLHQVSVEDVFTEISRQTGRRLSYNPDILPDRPVTVTLSNTTVRSLLEQTLGRSFQYKVRGSYIIIQSAKEEQSHSRNTIQFKGRVIDAQTGKKLPNASIYEVNKLNAALSAPDGTYDLTSTSYAETAVFAISKRNYQDTVIRMSRTQHDPMIFSLRPIPGSPSGTHTATDRDRLFGFLINKKTAQHTRNVSLTEKRWCQLSILPGIGTNGFLGGKVTNNLSLNIVGGYAHSVHGVELGGAFNIVRTTMTGMQAGGAGNAVGGTSEGVQIAGGINMVEDTKGLQLSGAVNTAVKSAHGAQITGGLNLADSLGGLQLSGAGNIARQKAGGAQISGGVNLAKESSGLQLSGVMNIASQQASGIQVAGGANIAKETSGLQLSGGMNYTRGRMNGTQISCLNYAGTVRGVQIGLINIADSVEKGVPIGLLNFIGNGLHHLEAQHNDVTAINLAYKLGIRQFYTLLTTGITPGDQGLWSYGYGVGHEVNFGKKVFTDIELSTHTLQPLEKHVKGLTMDNRLNLALGLRLFDEMAVTAGPVLHFYLYNKEEEEDFETFYGRFGNNPFTENTTEGSVRKLWIGYQAAFRF